MIRLSTYIAHSASQGYALRFPSIGEGNYRPAYYANGTNFVHGGKGTFQNYNQDQKTAIQALPESADDNDYCLFFVDCYDRLDTAGMVSNEIVSGYMPVGRHYGFIYNEFNNPRTIAHELGHGVNALHHTFSKDSESFCTTQKTDNLMDYNGGTTLNHLQWQWSHESHTNLLGFLDDEREGESKIAINEQILALLKSIRDANLNDEPSLSVSFTNMKYQLEVPRINFDLGKGQLRYLRLGDVNTENNLTGWLKSTAIIVPNETVETSYIKNDVKYARFTFKSATDSDKADIAFCIDVRDDEKDVLIDYLNPYKITTKQLKDIYPNATDERVKAVTEAINKYCNDFEINTPERMAHFLGQIGAETGQKLEDLSESSSYSARRVVEIFGYNKYGHLFEEAELNEATYEYTYKPIDYSCTSCTGNSIDKGTSTFALTRSEILNAYAEVKAEKEVEVDGKKVKKMLYNETPRTDVVLKDGKIEQYVSNTMYNEGKLRVKQQYINSNTLFNVTYACRMKNGTIASGDGSVYKGVGFIHLTGKGNYQSVVDTWNKMYPEDQLVLNHELIEKAKTDVNLAMKLAMAYWKMNKINTYVSNTSTFSNTNDDMRKVSGVVNAGSADTKDNNINLYNERLVNTIKAYNSLNKK